MKGVFKMVDRSISIEELEKVLTEAELDARMRFSYLPARAVAEAVIYVRGRLGLGEAEDGTEFDHGEMDLHD